MPTVSNPLIKAKSIKSRAPIYIFFPFDESQHLPPSGEMSSIKYYCVGSGWIKVICVGLRLHVFLAHSICFAHKNIKKITKFDFPIWEVYFLRSFAQSDSFCFARWFSMWIITRIELWWKRKLFLDILFFWLNVEKKLFLLFWIQQQEDALADAM